MAAQTAGMLPPASPATNNARTGEAHLVLEVLSFKGRDDLTRRYGIALFNMHSGNSATDLEGEVYLTNIDIAEQHQMIAAFVPIPVIFPA